MTSFVKGGWPLLTKLLKSGCRHRARCEIAARSRGAARRHRSVAVVTTVGIQAARAGPGHRRRRLHRLCAGAPAARKRPRRGRRRLRQRLLRSGAQGSAACGAAAVSAFQLSQDRSCRAQADRSACSRDGDFGPVVHLAAQAGVRYSLQHPHAYLDSNLSGFLNVLEGCRHRGIRHLVFASSSSVYGSNKRMPFSIHDNVDHPISLYAATKKANELMAHSYSHLYGLPTTGLRFFTVYGPWGRPDMAMFIFAKAISEGQPIRLFNYGRMRRDFTYVDDVTEAVERIIDIVAGEVGRRRQSAISIREPAPRRGASTISATTAPSRFPASSSCWSRNSAARRSSSSCRCSPATCRKAVPMSTISCAMSASGRRPRSSRGCAISPPGTATIIGSDHRALINVSCSGTAWTIMTP